MEFRTTLAFQRYGRKKPICKFVELTCSRSRAVLGPARRRTYFTDYFPVDSCCYWRIRPKMTEIRSGVERPYYLCIVYWQGKRTVDVSDRRTIITCAYSHARAWHVYVYTTITSVYTWYGGVLRNGPASNNLRRGFCTSVLSLWLCRRQFYRKLRWFRKPRSFLESASMVEWYVCIVQKIPVYGAVIRFRNAYVIRVYWRAERANLVAQFFL